MKAVLEGLIFLSGNEGITIDNIAKVTELNIDEVKTILDELKSDLENSERGIKLVILGNHYKFTTKEEHKEYYKKLVDSELDSNLSQSALETLAIIAYNQPITRIEIDEIRGVNSTYVMRKLLIKGLIEDIGRSELPGRPKQYIVTDLFLDHFGLESTDDLPDLKIEEEPSEEDNEQNLFKSKYTEENTEEEKETIEE
ncbi:MAG: SMC-Scp complex subunit ScpB [Bacilli bacterium]|nr:SMC-Scp complex subunit ScpB [Bacilli bacterium]